MTPQAHLKNTETEKIRALLMKALFKVNKKDARANCRIHSQITCSSAFTVNIEQASHADLVDSARREIPKALIFCVWVTLLEFEGPPPKCNANSTELFSPFVMRCAIWYHLHNLKNVKNTHGGVLILVKL